MFRLYQALVKRFPFYKEKPTRSSLFHEFHWPLLRVIQIVIFVVRVRIHQVLFKDSEVLNVNAHNFVNTAELPDGFQSPI